MRTTDAARVPRTRCVTTRSTSRWMRHRRAIASASSRSALRVPTATWQQARRARRTEAPRVHRAMTAFTCRTAIVWRSRCVVRGRRSRHTARRRQARAVRAVRTNTKTPRVTAKLRARRSRRVVRASACHRTRRSRCARAALAQRTHSSYPMAIATRLASLSRRAARASLCQPTR